MSEIQRVMKLLEDNSIQPKRAFGQNFLIDESISRFDISFNPLLEA